MKRKLIYTDRNGQTKFEKDLNRVRQKANELIKLFNENQPFIKVSTREEAELFLMEPLSYYDQTLIKNINLPDNGLEINVSKLAELYNIPRNEFIIQIGLKPDQVPGCNTCNPAPENISIKEIPFREYESFSEFLTWEGERFELNESAINKEMDSFNVYLINDKQIRYYNHFETVARVLNDHIMFARLGTDQINTLAKVTGLMVLNNSLVLNDIQIAQTIKSLN